MSDSKHAAGAITLDWSRLLGFDQVARQKDHHATPAAMVGSKVVSPVGAKVGSKPGRFIGAKVGAKGILASTRIGAKVGSKDN